MKTLIPLLAALMIIASIELSAQQFTGPNNTTGSIARTGPVGLNISSPRGILDIGTIGDGALSASLGRLAEGNGIGDGTYLAVRTFNTGTVNIRSFALEHGFGGVVNSSINFHRGNSWDDGFMSFSTMGAERMRIQRNGSISIGTVATGNYKLAVDGSIGAREVNVNATSWSDYVFDADYKLLPLTEIEKFIAAHHHLPEVPSATEVEEKGINVGEMNALLLKKIEELTLHIIAQEKRMNEQDKTIEEQGKRIKELEVKK